MKEFTITYRGEFTITLRAENAEVAKRNAIYGKGYIECVGELHSEFMEVEEEGVDYTIVKKGDEK